MSTKIDFVAEAKKLPYDVKKQYLLDAKETEIHRLLATLINRLEGCTAEITHGRDEHGSDLVVKIKDQLGTQFVAVVVKKGDQKGSLTGEVDGIIGEVIEQAKQAIAIPCPLHELEAGIVKINQIWVFFVGRLTRGASERIEFELKGVTNRLFTLEPIVNLFSEHYPEIFFDSNLAAFIEEKLKLLDSITPSGGRIRQIYVSPWVSKWEQASEITETLLNVIYSRRIPFNKLTEIVETGKRIILTGEPGIGKTTAIVKIASDMINNNFSLRNKGKTGEYIEIPMLLKAKEIVEKTEEEIYDNFITKKEMEDIVRIKTILVDGLDEIDLNQRESCLKKSTALADRFKCGLVITCRKVPTLMTVLRPFDTYELLPLEYNQAMTFIEKSLDDEKLIAILKEGIRHNELKMQLTPLALGLLVEVVTYEKEVPASVVEIFERYCDLVCGKYDKSKGIDMVFEHHIKARFLAELAWDEFYLKRRLGIPIETLDVFVKEFSHKHSWEGEKIKNFVSELERSGLLRKEGDVTFWHRSFLDYFIAYRINLRKTEYPNLDQDIVNIYFDDIWSDVAFNYVGIQREISDKITMGIAEWKGNEFDAYVSKVLIGRLLQAGWYTQSAGKIKAIEIGLKNAIKVRPS